MDWLQILGPPLLMVLGGIITWVIKSKNEELCAPYIRLFADLKGNQDPKEMIRLWGKLLLEIRKSLGNKKTKWIQIPFG